ncbi:PilN domain-containing protein [Thalassotalea aquiviva]|uniref:PilN domain-containing protein n=1 Tax=Thalassotalea aquiviva TaxID=3242415 RepID=UPI00352B3E89
MPHINLLPWREEAQRQRHQQFMSILTFLALVSFLVVFLISQVYQRQIDGQKARNQFLMNEIKVLDSRIEEIKTLEQKKEDLIQRMTLIDQLQKSRNVVTQILDEIVRIVPAGVYLTKMEKRGNTLLLIGKSESNNHLANMIREIQSSNLLADAELQSISNKGTNSKLLSDFNMKLRIQGLLGDEEMKGRRR